MISVFLSARTRNAVRDVLKAKPLQTSNDLFEECGEVRPGIPTLLREDREARHELIERRLSSLNLNLREDAIKLLRLVERIAEEWPDLSQGTTALDKLQQALLSDRFALELRKLISGELQVRDAEKAMGDIA